MIFAFILHFIPLDCLNFFRLVQSIFLLPRYLERNHERITKTFQKHGMLDDETADCIEDREQRKDGPNEEPEIVNESKKTD